jgi:HlyD family secretion protein
LTAVYSAPETIVSSQYAGSDQSGVDPDRREKRRAHNDLKIGDQMEEEVNSAPKAFEGAKLTPTEKRDLVPINQARNLQTVPSAGRVAPLRKRWLKVVLVLAVVMGGAGGGLYWWLHLQPQLPLSIAFGNGRIEAQEIDIDTKFPGRIAEILADAGDMVKAGQVVARMDTRDLSASLKKSQAAVLQARKAIGEAKANVVQQKSLLLLAQQEFDRASALLQKGAQTKEVVDQRQQTLDATDAASKAAQDRVVESQHAMEASTHDVELNEVNIADNTLVAPTEGRIQYRIANIGEVLPSGGKVFTMLDISYVYMDVYLPTEAAGKVKIGSDARIVLDAIPKLSIPAKVSFVATQAQFTPKTVETQSERDTLMFRIRAKIDPERLRVHADKVRSGLPGETYLLLDPATPWPARLQGSAAP